LTYAQKSTISHVDAVLIKSPQDTNYQRCHSWNDLARPLTRDDLAQLDAFVAIPEGEALAILEAVRHEQLRWLEAALT